MRLRHRYFAPTYQLKPKTNDKRCKDPTLPRWHNAQRCIRPMPILVVMVTVNTQAPVSTLSCSHGDGKSQWRNSLRSFGWHHYSLVTFQHILRSTRTQQAPRVLSSCPSYLLFLMRGCPWLSRTRSTSSSSYTLRNLLLPLTTKSRY